MINPEESRRLVLWGRMNGLIKTLTLEEITAEEEATKNALKAAAREYQRKKRALIRAKYDPPSLDPR
jgi:hypothetical protein